LEFAASAILAGSDGILELRQLAAHLGDQSGQVFHLRGQQTKLDFRAGHGFIVEFQFVFTDHTTINKAV
jgi:hypothetical protein